MGATMVMGRFFTAKYANVHELPTITDLRMICKCWANVKDSKCKTEVVGALPNVPYNNTGKTITALVSVEKNNTGITAFSFSDFFFNISYTPSSAADAMAINTQIILHFFVSRKGKQVQKLERNFIGSDLCLFKLIKRLRIVAPNI
jgi:hypothetical protein